MFRVPDEVEDAKIRLSTEEDEIPVSYTFGRDGRNRLVHVTSKTPVLVGQELSVSIRQSRGKLFKFPVRTAPA